ncbi:MAG TPA: DUF192 domain-containing protein [bacterium]|nr:DUF192 domain-containing protein [bacterium]
MRHQTVVVAVALAALVAAAAVPPRPARAQDCPAPTFKYRHGIVSFTEHGATVDVRVEVADTERMREIGLMCRRSLDPDAGMLFVFEDLTRDPFWMKNTFIPLSIAFLGDRWQVVGIIDMRVAPNPADPPPTDVWAPAKPYRYALEVNQGFFKTHNLDAHAQVRLTSGEPAKP